MASRQGSALGGGTLSTMTQMDLPNLPGMRRSASAINPKLYKEFKNATAGSSRGEDAPPTTGSFRFGEQLFDDYDINSYDGGDTGSKLMELKKSLSQFPEKSQSYNDTNGRYSLISQKEDRERNIRNLPFSSTTDASSVKSTYVTAQRLVCTYVAYFTENYAKHMEEQSRSVFIKLYLEDNSIEIVEPKVENSGGPCGKFLKRHQILRPVNKSSPRGTAPQGPLLYTVEDFRAGACLEIYDRTYYVVDCDAATRRYMTSVGIDFGESSNLPGSVYDPKTRPGMTRKALKTTGVKKEKKHGVLGFFEYDRKVLRFFGAWDCRDSLYGDDLRVKLHYSLADGFIEIVPMHERNNGRDKLPKFLKKNAIMKAREDFMTTTAPIIDDDSLQGYSSTGLISSGSMLTLFGEGPGIEPAQPYHWTDLKIGEVIPVAAYNVVLIDADDFTRSFYASKEMPLGQAIVPPAPVYPEVSDEPPPPLMAMPTKTKEEGIKAAFFMGISLRFRAKFIDPKEADKSREFVIQYFMENDTVQVMEPPVRNSGHKGGLFLARSQPKGLFNPKELYLGANVNLLNHKFTILDADMATFKFMEGYPDTWLMCNVEVVSGKMKERKELLQRAILTYPGMAHAVIDLSVMESIFKQAGLKFVKQEAKTIFRVIDPFHTNFCKMSKLLKFVMDL